MGGFFMAICTKCKANIPDGKRFCSKCGSPVGNARADVQKTTRPEPAPATRAAGNAPPYGSSYAVMSVGAYVGSSILMSIPVIGLIISLVWAFVSCSNQNKRNFARAYLIFLLIGIAISLLGFLSMIFLTSSIGIFGEFGGLKGFFDMLKQLRNIEP